MTVLYRVAVIRCRLDSVGSEKDTFFNEVHVALNLFSFLWAFTPFSPCLFVL